MTERMAKLVQKMKVSRRCECCGTDIAYTHCYCMIETLCKACNRCVEHCKCATPVQEIPYPMQLSIAKHELRLLGVAI